MTQLKHNGQFVFRTGTVQKLTFEFEPTKPKEDNDVNNAATKVINRLAKGVLQRAKDEAGIRVQIGEQPDPPPAVILARTEAQERIDEHYAKAETVKQNVAGVQGLESYAPPPCILKED